MRTAYILQMAGVLLLLPLILWLDSPALATTLGHESLGQWFANVLTFAYFGWMYRMGSSQLRKLMVIGLGVATAGEVLFSLVIGMYEYRLANIPLYVPPGHTILYAMVYYWIRLPWVRKNPQTVHMALYAAAAMFSVYWWQSHNDLYGFVCFTAYSIVMAFSRESRPFFLAMYMAVVYLELIGTTFGNWYWHSILLDKFSWMPSGNPPAGIAIFYFGFDIGCLGFYMLTNLDIRARYDRRKAYRKQRVRQAANNGQNAEIAEITLQ